MDIFVRVQSMLFRKSKVAPGGEMVIAESIRNISTNKEEKGNIVLSIYEVYNKTI